MAATMRPYQERAKTRTLEAFAASTRAVMICLATGTGKTYTAADVIRELGVGRDGRTVLWVAHLRELLDQAERSIKAQIPGVSIGYEVDNRHASKENQVIFGTIQGLSGARGARLLHAFANRLVLLVIDEAHRSASASYRHLIHAIKQGCPRSRILGLTATPNRTDKVTLADLYDEIAYSYSTRDAIFDGYLVAPRGYRISTSTTLKGVKSSGGDFAEGELARRINTVERNELGINAWLKYADKAKTLVFCAGVEHAEAVAARFRERGISAAAVYGNSKKFPMPDGKRKQIFKDFRAGRITVLCGAQLFVEGFDDPSVECVVFLRPTKSSIYYQQALGRSLRPHGSIANALAACEDRGERLRLIETSPKRNAKVIDLVDVASVGIVDLVSLFGPKRAGERERLRDSVGTEDDAQVPSSEESRDIGVRQDELGDELRATQVIIEPFDLLAAEAELTQTNSPFTWQSERPGARVLYLPRMPVGVLPDGSRSLKFEHTYAAAYKLKYDERVLRAKQADPSATLVMQDTEIIVEANADGSWSARERFRRGDTWREANIGEAASASEGVLVCDRHIMQQYAHMIKFLDRTAPWRSQPVSQNQRAQLQSFGLDPNEYTTRGEANDAITSALARLQKVAS